MEKVWNITDGSKYKGRSRTLMLFGKSVSPGRCVAVSEARLEKAHKLEKDVKSGAVYVGSRLPDWYTKEKEQVHLRLPKGHNRAHGEKAEKVVPAPSKKVSKEPKAEKPVEVVESAEAMVDKIQTDDPSEGIFSRKRKHKE